jgi:hypothetical protein
VAQALDDARQRVAGWRRVSGIQCARDHAGNVGGSRGARKLNKPDAAAEVVLHRPRRRHRKPAFADAGWTDQGHQPVPRNQLGHLG